MIATLVPDGFELDHTEMDMSMGGKRAASIGAARVIAQRLAGTGIAAAVSTPAYASSHREAPGITKTPSN